MQKKGQRKSSLKNAIFYSLVAAVVVLATAFTVLSIPHPAAQASALIDTANPVPFNPGHSANQIYIQYPNYNSAPCYITLQTAINESYLMYTNYSQITYTTTSISPGSPSTYSYVNPAYCITSLPTDSPYELASQILMSFKGTSMSLQQAVSNSAFLDGYSASYNPTYPSVSGAMSSVPAGGHSASSINASFWNLSLSMASGDLQSALGANSIGDYCIPLSTNPGCIIPGYVPSGLACTAWGYQSSSTRYCNPTADNSGKNSNYYGTIYQEGWYWTCNTQGLCGCIYGSYC